MKLLLKLILHLKKLLTGQVKLKKSLMNQLEKLLNINHIEKHLNSQQLQSLKLLNLKQDLKLDIKYGILDKHLVSNQTDGIEKISENKMQNL